MFVCGKNKLRSPTAENLFSDIDGISTLSAGTNRDAEEIVSDELVEWADVIFAMERVHRTKIRNRHMRALKGKQIVVLGIPDDYGFMDADLVKLLERKMERWLTKGSYSAD